MAWYYKRVIAAEDLDFGLLKVRRIVESHSNIIMNACLYVYYCFCTRIEGIYDCTVVSLACGNSVHKTRLN